MQFTDLECQKDLWESMALKTSDSSETDQTKFSINGSKIGFHLNRTISMNITSHLERLASEKVDQWLLHTSGRSPNV
jgi:hypothetical protein